MKNKIHITRKNHKRFISFKKRPDKKQRMKILESSIHRANSIVENIDDADWNKTVSESVRGETDVSLEAAAEGWQDDVLVEDFNYTSMAHDTFYRAPLRVVEVKKDDKKE